MSSSLWTWALAAWARPGVEPACLELQDIGGQSVALLLWRAWRAAERLATPPLLVEQAVALTGPVECDILRPIRAARRAMSAEQAVFAGQAGKGPRAKIRAAELALERALLTALAALSPGPSSGPETAADMTTALVSLMEIWSVTAPSLEMRHLAARLAIDLARELPEPLALLVSPTDG